jgi:hypothetical protein
LTKNKSAQSAITHALRGFCFSNTIQEAQMAKKYYKIKTMIVATDELFIKAKSLEEAVEIANNLPISCYFTDINYEYSENGYESDMNVEKIEVLKVEEIIKKDLRFEPDFLELQLDLKSEENFK